MVSVRTACLGVGVLEIEGGVGVGTDQKTAHKAIQAKRGIGGQGPRGAPQRGVVGMVRASLRGPLWGGGTAQRWGEFDPLRSRPTLLSMFGDCSQSSVAFCAGGCF